MTTTIDRYEILNTIGSGGMATVYRAHDPRFGREVAVKVMSADYAHNPTFAQRFEREARTIATLEHPAITPVHDFGEHEGCPFLVMRYMSGGSLSDRIRRGPLSLEESAHVLDRIAGALDWAHNQGIIHRDIKPANILFDQHDRPCLADFGIVKLTESTAHLTGSGIVGTPSYMAPEMMEEGGLTHLIDVYALGVTLYEMLTGQRPYKSDTPVGLMMAHAVKPVPDIRQVRPDLPGAIQGVIERGMAKDPVDRFQTAGALAVAFHEALRESAQPAGQVIDRPDLPPTTPEPVTSPAGPYAPTMDIVGDTPPSPPSYHPEPTPILSASPRPESAKQIGVRTGVRAIPWAWIAGIGAVIVIGIIGLLTLLNGGGEPSKTLAPAQTEEPVIAAENTQAPTLTLTDMPTPTDEPTPIPATPTDQPTLEPTRIPALVLAEAGVSSNDEWEPYIQEFDGVPMALVPAGYFMMGSEEFGDERPIHKVCFDEPFWIDVYEVTNEAFGSVGCESYSSDPDQPRNCVNWAESLAHCELRRARLPTEAEWEYAARGPDSLVYPWGNDFLADNVIYEGNSGGQTAPVGSKSGGVSWVGAYDLSGNVWEWVNDWYDADYYASSPESNPQGPESGDYRVLRGGSWNFYADLVRAVGRSRDSPVNTWGSYGFRCARSY